MEENKKGEILLYQTIDGVSKIEVTVYNDIVWLLDQVAELFQRNKSTISLHIKNIFDCGELQIDSTVAKFATVAAGCYSSGQLTTFHSPMLRSAASKETPTLSRVRPSAV